MLLHALVVISFANSISFRFAIAYDHPINYNKIPSDSQAEQEHMLSFNRQ